MIHPDPLDLWPQARLRFFKEAASAANCIAEATGLPPKGPKNAEALVAESVICDKCDK